MAGEWRETTLGEACRSTGGDIQTGPFGSQLHAADYVPVGIPSIMPQNIGDNRIIEEGIARITEADARRLTRYRVRVGDIVYSRRGDVERRALIRDSEDGWLCGTGCLRVRFGEHGVIPAFAAYYLSLPAIREWIVRHAHGATMPNLNTSILSECPFVIPPISEQYAIVRILGALDDKIELNRRMNQTLEDIARALFKSWFVDFDGVAQEDMQESELGLIPKGWRVARVSDFMALAYGKSLPAGKRKHGKVPVYGSGGINGFHDTASVGEETVIVGRKGTVGSLYWEQRPSFPIDTVFYVQAFAPLPFCYHLLEILPLRDMNTDAAVPGLNRENVYRLEVVSPPQKLIAEFSGIVTNLRARIFATQRESQTLTVLRDALLPRLVSGQLLVKDVEKGTAWG